MEDRIRLGPFGVGSGPLCESAHRAIDPEQDIYPPPLMTRAASRKVHGFDRIQYAIWYLEVPRLRSLLLSLREEEPPAQPLSQDRYETGPFSLYAKDFYESNLIEIVCQPNYPTNLSYENNVQLYDRLLFTVLNTLGERQLRYLLDNCQLETLLRHLDSRPHWLTALWYYGLEISPELVDSYLFKPIAWFFKLRPSCPKSQILLNLLEQEECPITQKGIQQPAILVNGRLFEFEAISRHLSKSDRCPVTRENLVDEDTSVSHKVGDSWVHGKKSYKVLYLPLENRFVYFPILDQSLLTVN
jgi:hypothetical protein